MTPTRITLSRAKGWRKPEGAIVVSRPSIWGNPWKPGNPGMFWLPNRNPWCPPLSGQPVGEELSQGQCLNLYLQGLYGGLIPIRHLPAQLNKNGRRIARILIRHHFAIINARLPELRGHDLCCWCQPGEPCHADVLIRMANG